MKEKRRMAGPPPVSRNSKPSGIPMEPLLPPTGIIYSLISRGDIVLADHSAAANFGNFVTVSRLILNKISYDGHPNKSYAYDEFVFHFVKSLFVCLFTKFLNSYSFHFLFKDGVTFMCMTDANYPRRYSLAFLEEIMVRNINLFYFILFFNFF